MGAVQYSRSGCPDTDVRTSRFEPLSYLLGPLGRRGLFLAYKDIQGGSEELRNIGARDRQRNRGLFSRLVRGVWRPCEPPEILSFLSQTHRSARSPLDPPGA